MPKEDYPDWQPYVDGECLCVYCGFDGKSSVLSWHQLTIDHVIPLRRKQGRRKGSELNIRENKVVACLSCNNIKRVWDKKYDDNKFPASTLQERIEKAKKSASGFIQKYYASIDPDYEPMLSEIRERETKATSAA